MISGGAETTVLDAQAILALLFGEPAGAAVGETIRRGAVVASPNLAEVVDRLMRIPGVTAEAVAGHIALLRWAGLSVAVSDDRLAVAAGRFRAERYHRTRSPISLADAFAAATALRLRAPLATADRALASAVTAAGGSVAPLP